MRLDRRKKGKKFKPMETSLNHRIDTTRGLNLKKIPKRSKVSGDAKKRNSSSRETRHTNVGEKRERKGGMAVGQGLNRVFRMEI